MKKLSILLFSALLLVLAGPAMAKKPKEDVYHCGCNVDGTDLVWSGLNVSRNSNGHRNHMAGDPEGCYAWVDLVWTHIDDYTRAYRDCEAPGGVNINGVIDCFATDGDDFEPTEGDFQTVGDSCSL